MRYLITLLVLALAFQMSAQNTSGIVIYEEIINSHHRHQWRRCQQRGNQD